ncbi:alpha/beta fold hydrolase [Sphingomonas echinoides]|jgi:pimeloyl-ACP methyl ester carboxylesterase|uniref:Palmitoyl-protein thioesterase ABHD10, mitochondrial n=1 Tax=Sphingomonas echinoides TaxID=59803 RepID=A0ABU4PP47_9SPHN|nr:alpha/beta hydrolase [Sphingomonas echinoides]MDX5985938.1 alpha/beta hydrolase [Sphingomonas echinoides]
MTDTSPPARPALAYHLTEGTGPTVVFLPGYGSDMEGTKALALEAWAKRTGHAYLRFDYGGCGQSAGAFEEQTLAGWRDDVLAMLDQLVEGPAVLVGSSLGGWLMLLVARDHPEKVAALVGIAPAPDFTDWGFTVDEKLQILSEGRLEKVGRYADLPMVYTRAFWQSGEANRVLFSGLPIDVPVRLLHGMADAEVPANRTIRLAEVIRSAKVQVTLIKDGDHRLSREADLALLIAAVEDVTRAL